MDRSSAQQVEMLIEEVKKELQQTSNHQMPFVRLMELALYHPTYGYYTKPTPKLGKTGDFFTNVHVSDLFGRVLANYFLQHWKMISPSSPLTLIEMGSGDGRLMEQIAFQCKQLEIAGQDIIFYSIERSPYHREEQKKRLQYLCYPVNWVDDLVEVPQSSFAIVFSNELVDAFPVHRLKRQKEKWTELYITNQAERLVERYGELSTAELTRYSEQLEEEVAEGQALEVNLYAKKWIMEIADWFQQGMLLTIDYGGTSRELHASRYLDGTMRYYQAHQHIENPYGMLGNVDMTSHVNFDDLMRWGISSGLSTSFYGSQAKFLVDAGILTFTESHYVNAIKQLVMGMGESFQVLVQQK